MSGDVVFDTYRPGDLERCAILAAEAWPLTRRLVTPGDVPRLMKAYVRLALLATTWTRVARIDGQVAGLCFGMVQRIMTPARVARVAMGSLGLLLGLLAGKHGRLRDPAGFLRRFGELEGKTRKILHAFDAEITLLVVDESLRGKGVGRSLVEAFVAHAGKNGASSVCLYTDVQSNWRFYEKIGFTRHGDFHDPYLSHLKGVPVRSFVYARHVVTRPPSSLIKPVR